MDTYAAVTKNPKKLLLADKGADSLLLRAVTTTDANMRMPLGGKPLPEGEVAVLRAWIDPGAKEGTRPDADPTVIPTAPPRTRKLPVVLTTTTTPPSGALGPGTPAPLQLALPVGPLAMFHKVLFFHLGHSAASGSTANSEKNGGRRT